MQKQQIQTLTYHSHYSFFRQMSKLVICKVLLIIVSINIVSIYSEQPKQNWIPKIIWTWWANKIPNDAHHLKIYENNRQLWKKGWELRHLDDTNQEQWLKQVPDYNNFLNEEYFKFTEQSMKSDLIRITIVKHFGGVYLDYSIMLTESLDWLLNPKQQSLIQYKFGETPDVILMFNSFHGNKQKTLDFQSNKQVLYKPTFENFFVAAKPKAKFVQQWFDTYVAVRKQSYKRYGNDSSKTYAKQIMIQNNFTNLSWNGAHFQQSMCGPIVTQRKQKQFDKQWEKDKTKPRALALKYYNIWSIDTGKTSYKVHQSVSFNRNDIMKSFLQQDIQVLKQRDQFPQYFMKIYQGIRDRITHFLLNQTAAKALPCKNDKYIIQNSLAYQYLLKDYPVKFYYNEVVKKSQDLCLPKTSQITTTVTSSQPNLDLQSIKKQLNEGISKIDQNKADISLIKSQIQSLNKQISNNEGTKKQSSQQSKNNIQLIKNSLELLNKKLNDNQKANKQQIENIKKQLATKQLSNVKVDIQSIKKQLSEGNNKIDQNKADISLIQSEKQKQQIKELKQKIQLLIKQNAQIKAQTLNLSFKLKQKKTIQQNYHKNQQQKSLKQIQSLQTTINDPKQLIYISVAILIVVLNVIIIYCFLKFSKKIQKKQNQISQTSGVLNEGNKTQY